MAFRKIVIVFLLLFCCITKSGYATHLYGGELRYNHISGNLYKVTLVLFGDCGAGSGVFSDLYTASPNIQVYKGSSLIRTMYLSVQSGAGTEVTPVCPLSLDSTTCHGGKIPGVRRFEYADTITLSPSTNWKCRFTGTFSGVSSSAGRSSSITNIFSPGTSLMTLEATLNNSSQPNSNPSYTTIPTPFFCINVPQEYNQGAVDSNLTDSLAYALVDGLDASSGTVSYRPGYSGSSPLAVATGTFSFSSTTGQLTFKPNLTQTSLVVCKVSEYRSGVLVGTSMREMNFIVLGSCSNRSPIGKISSVTGGGTAISNTEANICKNDTLLKFNINPVDSDGNNITVSVAGLPSGATFTITGNGTTTPTCAFSWNIKTISAGKYTFFVTYQDNACPLSSKQTVAYTINIFPEPPFSISNVSLATCTKKAVFDVIPSGAGSPWSLKIFKSSTLILNYTGLTGTKRDSLDPGIYTFRLSNNNGCFKDTSYTILPPPALTISSLSATSPKCYNLTNGTITVLAGGGLTSYQYRIDGGSFVSSGNFTGLSAGVHTIRIKDANDCTKDTSISLINPDSIMVSAAARPALCNAVNSGLVIITASGGSGKLTYAKGITGTFDTSNIFNALAAGTYIFRIRDTNDCIKTITQEVTDSIVLVAASVGIANVSCFGGNNGAITISPSNGFVPYTYALDAGIYGSSPTFSSLTANAYTIHVKDSLGCYLDSLVTVTQPAKLGISLTTSNISCFAGNNGSIVAAISGGVKPYTYALDAGSFVSSPSFTSLTAKMYTVTVKDSNACTKDTMLTLTQPSEIVIAAFSLTIPKCVGSADGEASISASGGRGTLSYKIDGGTFGTSGSFTGLLAGSHIISIRDENNCTKDTTFNLLNPNPLVIQSFSFTNPKCFGSLDGTTTIVASGGASSFQYRIDGGSYSSASSFTGLSAGAHTIRIKDGNDCTKDTTFNLVNPDSIVLKASIRKNLCNTSKNGLVRVIATGGVGAFTYEKNASGVFLTSNIFDSLAIGTYTFRVKDSNNCSKGITVEIVDSIKVTTAISITNVSCFGGKDGSITLSPYIGTSPFTYAIGTGLYGINPSFGSLLTDTYSLRVKDANGCTLDTFATVTQPTKLELELSLTPPSCNGSSDGSITAIGVGGTTPYSYAIDSKPFSSSSLFNGLSSKSFVIRIKDANGCSSDTTILLTQPDPIYFTAIIQPPFCFGDANGSITINAEGGVPTYTYEYLGITPQIENTFSQLKAGNYSVTVTDKNGCKKDSSIVMDQPEKMRFSQTIIRNPTCETYADGAVTVLIKGGIKPYKYAIGEGNYQFMDSFSKLREGFYDLHIIDSNNCQLDTTIELIGYPKIVLDQNPAIPTTCFGKVDGSFIVIAKGGNPPLRYTFENSGDTLSEANYKNLASQNYVVTVMDATNCFKQFSTFVPQPEPIKITTDITHNDCIGLDTNGKIVAQVSGGTMPYNYRWAFDNSSKPFLSGLENGFYVLTVKDVHDCSDSLTAEIHYENCCTPSIPNAFSPNNDGKNDVFRILYKGDVVLKEFSIYNRYGQQIFTTNNVNQGWDGRFNGRDEDLGVYFYMVKMICGNLKNKEVFFKGDVTLIR